LNHRNSHRVAGIRVCAPKTSFKLATFQRRLKTLFKLATFQGPQKIYLRPCASSDASYANFAASNAKSGVSDLFDGDQMRIQSPQTRFQRLKRALRLTNANICARVLVPALQTRLPTPPTRTPPPKTRSPAFQTRFSAANREFSRLNRVFQRLKRELRRTNANPGSGGRVKRARKSC
jgi:hypothetical protein